MKLTQKALIVKYLNKQGMGVWVKGYDLVKYASGKENIIQDADTRAYEVVNEGFKSDKYNYVLEHRRVGKYAEFRIASKTLLKGQITRNSPIPDLPQIINQMELYWKSI